MDYVIEHRCALCLYPCEWSPARGCDPQVARPQRGVYTSSCPFCHCQREPTASVTLPLFWSGFIPESNLLASLSHPLRKTIYVVYGSPEPLLSSTCIYVRVDQFPGRPANWAAFSFNRGLVFYSQPGLPSKRGMSKGLLTGWRQTACTTEVVWQERKALLQN